MQHLIPEFDKLKRRYPAGFESSLVLPCLRRIQEDRGYVADEDIAGLVDYLGVPRIQIEEVLSFYGQFRRQPIGRCHVQACRNISCSLLGAERIVDHLQQVLGIAPGRRRRRAFHFVHGRVPRRVRNGPGADDQRHLPREHDARKGRRASARASKDGEHEAPDDLPGHRRVAHACRVPAAKATALARRPCWQLTPQQVIAEVTASGIQGRGGAAFPMGRKWGVVHLERRPAALSVRQRRLERSTCDSAAKFTTASTPCGHLHHQVAVLDAAHHQLDAVGHVLASARVGELVEHHHVVLVLEQARVCRADESGSAGHEQLHAGTPR